MKWHFSRQLADQVESEVTQRDQFDNDDVNISETIIREALQNSLDAAEGDAATVEVRLALLKDLTPTKVGLLKTMLHSQLEHAEAAGLDLQKVDFEKPSVLVIEDFGTRGLTGSTSEKDDGHFSDFWRRHGKSHKSGKKVGRWGLGKLVFSCASMVGAFYGLTRRAGDDADHLMGQTVLNLRTIDGITYPPHGYFCDLENEEDPYSRIPVPVKDGDFVSRFIDTFNLRRTKGPGLSIVIPYPSPSLSLDEMIGIAIANYFYPIITGKLVLGFNDFVVNSENVRSLAHNYAGDHFLQIDPLFDFIEEVSKGNTESIYSIRSGWDADGQLDEEDFDAGVLEEIRSRFESGELVGLELPLTLKKKDDTEIDTFIKVFMKRPQGLQHGIDLYVRGGLTLPREAKFKERRALAVLIAEDEPICDFLGDAENAAHTLWTTNTEKLRKNYRGTQPTVTVIKKSLIQMYDLLADITEEVDEDALTQFFWYQEPKSEGGKKRKRQPRPSAPPALPKKKERFKISKSAGGFSLSAGPGLSESMLPVQVRVTVAYDVARGDAFKKWSPHDFDVPKNISTHLNGGAKLISAAGQTWHLEVTAKDFGLTVSGFDENRDLKARVS